MRSHGLLYLINYKLFGWNPTGWYLTAVILHILAVLLVFKFAKIILENKKLAFIVALLFGVNVTHHDVVNWGSFEGLYAFLLVVFLLAIFTFRRFQKESGNLKILWYLSTLLFFIFGLFAREVSLILPGLLLSYELYTKKFKFSKNYISYLFWTFLPFALISLGYLYFRSSYGGAPHDFIDAMVQLRITLLSQGRYAEYIWRGILSFGRFAAAHVIPYPFLNNIREVFAQSFRPELVNYYFFPFLGLLYTVLMGCVIYIARKTKKFTLLIFSFLWFFIPTFFFSFAFSITDDALLKAYVWDASRWRYFSFLGTVIFWVTVFLIFYGGRKKRRYIKHLGPALIIFVLITNFVLLRGIQKEMYQATFGPARNFYTTFLNQFKTLPEDFVFYHYPNAYQLNDYLSEWYLLRDVYHPNLKEARRDWAEVSFGMFLSRLEEGSVDLSKTLFIDMSEKGEVFDRTKDAKNVINELKDYFYSIKSLVDGSYSLNLDEKLHVEIPYQIEFATLAPTKTYQPDFITRSWLSFLDETKVEVCATAPWGSRGDAAMHLLPKHLTDATLGRRSLWVANCRRPAWIILDLGNKKEVGAFAFHAMADSPSSPSDYSVFVSSDGETWEEVISEKLNTLSQKIERFPKVHQARYVKLEVYETTRGGLLEIDEVAVFPDNKIGWGDDFDKLIEHMYKDAGFIEFSWETEPYDQEKDKKKYVPFISDGKLRKYIFEPNESEVYSAPGDFLKRFIVKFQFNFIGSSSKMYIESIKIVPKFKT